MFGAYHYGALRSYGEMAKGLISDDVPQAERLKSLDRLAMLGLVQTPVAYPQLDKLAKLLTGDKTAEFRRAGASTFVWNLAQLARGDNMPTEVLESVVTPAAHTKAAVELALNRNLYTGRKVYDASAPVWTSRSRLADTRRRRSRRLEQASRVAWRMRTRSRSSRRGWRESAPKSRLPQRSLPQRWPWVSLALGTGERRPAPSERTRPHLRGEAPQW